MLKVARVDLERGVIMFAEWDVTIDIFVNRQDKYHVSIIWSTWFITPWMKKNLKKYYATAISIIKKEDERVLKLLKKQELFKRQMNLPI